MKLFRKLFVFMVGFGLLAGQGNLFAMDQQEEELKELLLNVEIVANLKLGALAYFNRVVQSIKEGVRDNAEEGALTPIQLVMKLKEFSPQLAASPHDGLYNFVQALILLEKESLALDDEAKKLFEELVCFKNCVEYFCKHFSHDLSFIRTEKGFELFLHWQKKHCDIVYGREEQASPSQGFLPEGWLPVEELQRILQQKGDRNRSNK